MSKKLVAMSVLMLALPPLGTAQSDQGITSPARPSAMFTPEGKPERLDFKFGGDITGWIRNKGGWHVEGTVGHAGLLCGTYELGMRFGVSEPGCSQVHWLSELEYGTRVTQCNNASQHHDGGGYIPALAKDFDRITCAELVIRCTGNCK